MGALLEVIAPVFAVVGLGYLAARRNWVDEPGFRGLNLFVFAIAAPALLFAGGTAGHQGGGAAALAFFLASAVLYAFALWLGRSPLGLPLGEAGLFALNCTFGNTVMMGIPVVAAAFGQAGLTILLAILALHSMLLLGMATIVAEIGLHAHAPWRRVLWATLKGVARNPIVVAVAAALVWSSLSLPVPGPVRRTLELLGAASPPVALFCLGGSLVGFDTARGLRETAVATVLKLLAMPALVWGACTLLRLGPLETAVAVTTAALPTGANAFMLARRYATGADRSGATVLASTILSVVTLAWALAWFRPF